MLAIEVDGVSHNHEEACVKDDIRQAKLESFGIKFLRFAEADIKYDMQNVIRSIEGKIIEIIKIDKSMRCPKNFDIFWLNE